MGRLRFEVTDMETDEPSKPICQAPARDAPRDRSMTTWRRVRRLLVVIPSTYLGVCLLIFAFQSRMIYFPSRDVWATPREVGLSFEDVSLETDDGIGIHGWFVPREGARASVLFCHGNAGNIADRLGTIKLLHLADLNVFAFDYRGYGRSAGTPSEQGTYADAEAAWRYLTRDRGIPPERIVLFGRSLGGAVAIELATRHAPGALVVESTFTNLYDIGRLHYPFLPVKWLLSYRYDSIAKVGAITCPKLFVHGRDDTLIPLANGRKLFDAAAEPKTFLETPGDHNNSGISYAPEYAKRFSTFLLEAISKSGS